MNLSLLPIIIIFSTPFIFAYGDQMGRLALELEDSPGSGTFTEVWFQQGNQGNQWNQIIVDLSGSSYDNTGQRQIRFVATDIAVGVQSDMAIDEITILGNIISSPKSSTIFSFEDFESGFTTWTNTSGDDNDCWFRDSSGTPTRNTGPSMGADATNWYVFYESSTENSCSANFDQAFLLGPIIDFNSTNSVKVQFWRHMLDETALVLPDLDFMIYKGNQYNNLGDYKTAISIFKKVIKMDKDNADALANLGHSFFLNKNYNLAINSYEQALDINPNDNLVLHRLQKALLETSSYKLGFLDGVLEIKVYDSQDRLVTYLQSSEIKALNHPISVKFVESWSTSQIVYRNNQDYIIHQIEFEEVLEHDTILGFHELPFSYKMDLPLASTWHYQIPVEKGDVIRYAYSIFRLIN